MKAATNAGALRVALCASKSSDSKRERSASSTSKTWMAPPSNCRRAVLAARRLASVACTSMAFSVCARDRRTSAFSVSSMARSTVRSYTAKFSAVAELAAAMRDPSRPDAEIRDLFHAAYHTTDTEDPGRTEARIALIETAFAPQNHALFEAFGYDNTLSGFALPGA